MSSSSFFRGSFGQFLRYAIAGGAALAAQLLVLTGLVEGFGWNGTLATSVGFAVAILVNYALQYRFAFRATAAHRGAFLRYLGVTLIGLLVNAAIFDILTRRLGVRYIAAQVVATGVLFVINFFVNRRFTFQAGSTVETGR